MYDNIMCNIWCMWVTHHQVIIINNIRLLNLYNYRLTPDDKLHEYSTLQSSRGKTGLTSFETWTGEDDDLIVENVIVDGMM